AFIVAVLKLRNDAARVAMETNDPHPSTDVATAQGALRCVEQDPVELAARTTELRRVVTGLQTARVVPYLLSQTGCECDAARADTGGVQLREKSQMLQDDDCVRQQVNSNSKVTELACLFKDLDVD